MVKGTKFNYKRWISLVIAALLAISVLNTMFTSLITIDHHDTHATSEEDHDPHNHSEHTEENSINLTIIGIIAVSFIMSMAIKPKLKMWIAIGGALTALGYGWISGVPPWEIISTNSHGNQLGWFLLTLLIFVTFLGELSTFIGLSKFAIRMSDSGRSLATILAIFSSLLTMFADEATGISVQRKIAVSIAKNQEGINKQCLEFLLSIAVRFGNLVSGTTPIANPASIAVALAFSLTLPDFFLNVWPVVLPAFAIGVFYMWRFDTNDIEILHKERDTYYPQETHESMVIVGLSLMLGFILAMATHATIEASLNLPHNTLFVVIPTTFAGIALLGSWLIPSQNVAQLLRHFEKEELSTPITIWCITLMVAVLEYAGFAHVLADTMESLIGSNIFLLGITIIILGTIITNSMDNVVAALVLSSVVLNLNLPDAQQAVAAFLIAVTVTATSSFISIGSVGGIMAQLSLHPFHAELNFNAWRKRYWGFTALTSIISLALLLIRLIFTSSG